MSDEIIPLEILDTNFNFPDMRKVAIASANAFLLVFAVDNVQSFKEMSDLWNEICESSTNIRGVPTVVAGNKCDLPTKKIFEATATAWTSRLNANIRYLETSAKTAQNITNVFRTLLELSGLTFLKELVFNDARENSFETPRRMVCSARGTIRKKDEFMTGTESPLHSHGKDGFLRRNRSLKLKSEKNHDDERVPDRIYEGASRLFRSKSLVRRTKHLSLKIRKSSDKQTGNGDEDNDCRVS